MTGSQTESMLEESNELTKCFQFPDEEVNTPSFRFLKPDEATYIVSTLEKDRADVELEPFNWRKFLKPAREIEIWGFALIFL